MIKKYNDILSKIDIELILNLPEVKKAKEDIDKKIDGSIYFTIDIFPNIQKILFDNFGLNLTQVPMRWIKGDTKPHLDHGKSNFTNTYLIYLTDSKGELLIEDYSYPIKKNTAYMFSEGLKHQTINTEDNPRLLLGPMSDFGFPVGAATTITANGAADTIYFKYTNGEGVSYKINDDSYNGLSLPITIINSNTSSTLQVLFENDITITSDIFYFKCGSNNIQFGSKSLKNDGTCPIITIDTVFNYPGLIKNGDNVSDGKNNIYIFNLKVLSKNESTLSTGGGWVGQNYFAINSVENYIINCSSDGNIIDGGGGIVGQYAANFGGKLNIIGCSSTGIIAGTYSGGIIGLYGASGNEGLIYCESCWSEGDITGIEAGGIIGAYTGRDHQGSVIIGKCYSTGNITGIYSGGLAGSNCKNLQFSGGNYSLGNITGSGAGGIVGSQSYSSILTGSESGVYSIGSISADSGGIFGASSSATPVKCYACGPLLGVNGQITAGSTDIPSDCAYSNGWSTTVANTVINSTGIFSPWISTNVNQPYELQPFGYTPYLTQNIGLDPVDNLNTINTYETTISVGTSTIPAIISNKSYTILKILNQNQEPITNNTISINPITGVISTTSSTQPDIYYLVIRNTGSYNITYVVLTVTPGNSIIPRINSFGVSDLLLAELTNAIELAKDGGVGPYSSNYTVYNTVLLELLNNALLKEDS